MNCVNLQQMFGEQYQIRFDEAYEPRNVPHAKRDPWMMQIPCAGRCVTVYPHGGTTLALEVDRHPSIATKLAALGLRLHQDGDTEKTFLFDVIQFEEVARIVRPRKRRVPTQTQLEVLSKHAFQARDGAQKSTPKRAQTPQGDIPFTNGHLLRRTP